MPSCCICYTTDQTYLLPTLVSAIQARRHADRAKADIAIFSFGASGRTDDLFCHAAQQEGINFYSTSPKVIEGANVMLARLFLSRIVPTNYDNFLYIDGDTQITNSLDPLIDYDVPNGRFLAASDPMTFAIPGPEKHGRELAAYFSSLGISSSQQTNYFNTGVLRINRNGWDDIGLLAWKLFNIHRGLSRFPDQDALNLAGIDCRIPMSLAWNFPIFMANARVKNQIKPRIYHFMGSPKPWHGAFLPWNESVHQPYLDIVQKYPDLEPYLPLMPSPKIARYFFQQQYKRILETVTWGLSDRRARILQYEINSAHGTA
jgi:lipopolysaccharide biosynthesis glycosyltransferase